MDRLAKSTEGTRAPDVDGVRVPRKVANFGAFTRRVIADRKEADRRCARMRNRAFGVWRNHWDPKKSAYGGQ